MGKLEPGLSASEICQIIEAAKGSRIAKLKYRDLEIVTHKDDLQERVEIAQPLLELPETKGTPSLSNQPEPAPSVLLPRDPEDLAEEDKLALLKIEDPEEYEKRLALGDVEDEQAYPQ